MKKEKCYYCKSKDSNLEMLNGNLACTKCIERYEINKNNPNSDVPRSKHKIEDEFKEKFVCAKCKSTEAISKNIATTGDGFSRLIDLQHNEFMVITCKTCGYSEMYDLEILESKNNLTPFLDLFFGS
jgi:uncharacterized protein